MNILVISKDELRDLDGDVEDVQAHLANRHNRILVTCWGDHVFRHLEERTWDRIIIGIWYYDLPKKVQDSFYAHTIGVTIVPDNSAVST